MSRAKAVVLGALALGMAPDPVIQPSAWAAQHLIVADGPMAGHKWSADLTPYARDILDCLAAESPHTSVSVRKSAQTGLTEVGVAWIATIIDATPAATLVVFPTLDTARDFNRSKLNLTIEQTPALSRKVREQRSRSAKASSQLRKSFPGGSIVLTGANSAADLRSKTIRWLFCDEIDGWPLDLDGEGDPMDMADARQIAYHATADYKKFQISTPLLSGASRIDAAFEAGDQRYFQVPCPHCKTFQRLVFGGPDKDYGLKFKTEWPYQATYACRHCGVRIEHHEKRDMVKSGKWVAENSGPGKQPSFHIDALCSLLTTWDKLAEAFLKAKGDPIKLKAFVNLWLGESWEEKGEAPDWQRLFVRREPWPARHIPAGGVIVTAGVDVQQDGIYYEVIAWGQDRQSWSIDIGFLSGETADPNSRVWQAIDEVYERRYPNAAGHLVPIDRLAIDAGYNSSEVYHWVRTRHRAMAIMGVSGWHKASISSSPTKVDINLKGKRVKRRAAELWHIGTWGLKGRLYADLRKDGCRDGAELDPAGFIHLSENVHDERYLRQLTAEHINERTVGNRKVVREWTAGSRENHFHDCRIYAMAMAEQMGVGLMPEADWAKWVEMRSIPNPHGGALLAGMLGDAVPKSDKEIKPSMQESPAEATAEIKEGVSQVQPKRRPRLKVTQRNKRGSGGVGYV